MILKTALGASLLAVLFTGILNADSLEVAHAQSIAATYPENDSEPVRTFSASDDEGTVLAWFLAGADGGDLTIDDGVLNFRTPPDYEAPPDANGDNIYDLSVNVTDGTNTTTADLTVTVVNVDEAGTVFLSSLQPEVDIPPAANLVDPDGELTDVRWTWETSTDKTSWSQHAGTTSDSYTPVA